MWMCAVFMQCRLVCSPEWEGGDRQAGEAADRLLALDGVIRVVVGCQVTVSTSMPNCPQSSGNMMLLHARKSCIVRTCRLE